MAGNYMESGTRTEAAPINAFNKSSSSVIGTGDTVILPDAPATVFEHEAELGIVIGKKASAIKADQAFDHIFGVRELHRRLLPRRRPREQGQLLHRQVVGHPSAQWGRVW